MRVAKWVPEAAGVIDTPACANVSAHVQCQRPFLLFRNLRGCSSDMSEDRPADDQGEGVDAAFELSSDALAELVGLNLANRLLGYM
jgi:hypothetical protein